ncbi:MAG: glutamate racemase [Actinobacteria bacterium]|nr:glutamate racemase [Actinomycetota bacterium]
MPDGRPIGIFDSGVGGLTVARSVMDLVPKESLIYVGDTANFPYGPRTQEEIKDFAVTIAQYLVERDVKMVVTACNSVEVSAIEDVARAAQVPVVGVIDPGMRAAARVTRTGRIGLIGTEATVSSGAYERAAGRAGAGIELISQACPVFVEHVERGDTTSDALSESARKYLAPLQAAQVDTLILGCTHYPMLAGLIAYVMGPEVTLVSSAEETAKDVYSALLDMDLAVEGDAAAVHEFLCTGEPQQFQSVAEVFLGADAAVSARQVVI